MKKHLFIAVILSVATLTSLNAQVDNRGNVRGDVPSVFENHEAKPNRNDKVYTKDLIINGVVVDKRVAKYYKEEELNEMPAAKLKQLNFMYLNSFSVKNPDGLSNATKNYINDKFDTGGYEKYRKQTERVNVSVSADAQNFQIELLSREELNIELAKIK